MTTKPKATKYRIRRGKSLTAAAKTDAVNNPEVDAEVKSEKPAAKTPANKKEKPKAPQQEELAQPDEAAAPADEKNAEKEAPEKELTAEEAILEIRKEGLTGRQLRMARRIAQRHGLVTSSDYDAVRQLRAQNIDPFKRANMLEVVVEDKDDDKLPQTVAKKKGGDLPATIVEAEDQRMLEIRRIQQDIARRRRKKLMLLVTRLAFFVFLPTFLAGYYFYNIATPLYATKSEFVIQQSDTLGGTSGLGGLFSGTGFATSQDSIAVQGFLQSRAAMLRLDNDHGFKDHFSAPHLDSITRLEEDATNEQAFKLYTRHVKVSYDPTEGIIKLSVSATTPEDSARFSEALVNYAEEYVDSLSDRLRDDQMSGARDSFIEAEQKMIAAQQSVIDLQEKYDVLSTDLEIQLLITRIATLEGQLMQEQLSLTELLANPRPNQARVEPLQNRISTLEGSIADLRDQLTKNSTEGISLARVSSELAMAQADLETRNLMMQQALQQLETARIEANRQTRYLETGVTPVAPDEPTYPRSFENTILSFLIFSGIYLMISLTASVLREQVSS